MHHLTASRMMADMALRRRLVLALAISTLLAAALAGDAQARNSLGLGGAEQAITPGGNGWFDGVLFWIQQQQKAFYRSMTEALRLIRSGEGGTWVLVGLSFAYGVLHAAGPGHGKVVISSYMVANETQLRRGVLLSALSSLLQAVVAIAAIGSIVFVLNGFGLRQGDLQRNLEIASYAAVAALGAWLVWRKAAGLFAASPAGTQLHAGHHHHDHDHDHDHRHGHAHHHHHDHHGHAHGHAHHHDHVHGHHHDHAGHCSDCGHAHMPDPAMLKDRMGWREAGSAILAVGLRPCTGALIVLTFAFLNGIYMAGILATFAMAAGTAITVSAIASMAVLAKGAALRLAGVNTIGWRIGLIVELAGALIILLLGLTLLSAALQA